MKALKIDILRTFQARLEMHCDNLIGDEIQGDELPILHEPPRRVNIKLPYTPITVSDFLFPGETQEESVKAVEEMLGFTPNFEHLDDELEIVASPQHIRVCILLFCSCQAVIRQSSGSCLALYGHSSTRNPPKLTFIFFRF